MTVNDTTPLVDSDYLLEKFEGKGGWTYAIIPEVLQDKHAPFGWVRVKGYIDDYQLNNYRLMPMGNGKLFLPVRAEIRKKIGKKQGDSIHVVLFADDDPISLPEELKLCFEVEKDAFQIFQDLKEGEQKALSDWINAARDDMEKIDRISVTLEKLRKKGGLKNK